MANPVSRTGQGLPSLDVPVVDKNGNITQAWHLFLTALWKRTGSAQGVDATVIASEVQTASTAAETAATAAASATAAAATVATSLTSVTALANQGVLMGAFETVPTVRTDPLLAALVMS
jgi:hypothetical protein